MTVETPPLTSGQSAFLGSMLANLNFWGVRGDGQTPDMVFGSYELSGTDGNIDLTAIQGEQGPPGVPADIVKMQYEDNFTSPTQLPENLENVALDIGKAWWIGNVVYVWTGTTFYQKQMGVPGPVGPTPNITCQSELVPSGTPTSLTTPIEVQPFGTPQNPTLLFQFDQDSITGPAGPTGPIVDAPDYSNLTIPNDGDAILWNAMLQQFMPGSFDLMSVPCYSVPEGAFEAVANTQGATQQEVLQFSIPPQPFNFIPIVFGQVAAVENVSGGGFFEVLFADLFGGGTITPANVGATVMLGDATHGQLVARGFGNVSNYAFIFPHFSTPITPNTAISPTSSTAVVPAYHTGKQGTLFVSLGNDGPLVGWQFVGQNSQLIIMCIPVSDFIPPTGPGNVLHSKGTLHALAVKV